MKITIHPSPKGDYKNINFDTDDLPCVIPIAKGGKVIIEVSQENEKNSIYLERGEVCDYCELNVGDCQDSGGYSCFKGRKLLPKQ